MKKRLKLKLFAVLLSLMTGVLGCHQPKPESQSLLSPEGQSLCELYQSLNRIKMDAAEAKGLIEARERVLAEQELILPAGKALLENAQAGQPIVIDLISYTQEQVGDDLDRREKQSQLLRRALTGGKIQLGKLEDMITSYSETTAKNRLKLDEAEADRAELMALADYQLVEISDIRTAQGKGLKALLVPANKRLEAKLKLVQKSQQIDIFPDVLEENFIPTTFWLRQVMIYQAEAEKRRQDEEARHMDRLLMEAERAEKQKKAAEEERRRQMEAEKQRKAVEEQQRQQAEANNVVPVCVVDNWISDVPAFLFINKKTGKRIPVLVPNKRYCVRQMPIGEYHVEIQYNGRVYSKTDAEVTKELSASYDNNWYHCVVKASDGS